MKLVYSKKYEVELGTHPFSTVKYRLVAESLAREKIITVTDLLNSPAAADEELLLAHTEKYVRKVKSLSLSYSELVTLEIPLSNEIVDAAVTCCGGTILACELALHSGVGIHIGGGFHHAFPDHGEGFCVFNDMAVAIKKIQQQKKAGKMLIIDCDVHQGNGTAFIFSGDADIFTFSIHEGDIYPFPKQKSSLDIEIEPGTTDDLYLALLEEKIPGILDSHKPELVMYQAGADPYEVDQIGRVKLTVDGLHSRDKYIYEQLKKRNIPAVVVLGGGYALDARDTVKIHSNTVKTFMGFE